MSAAGRAGGRTSEPRDHEFEEVRLDAEPAQDHLEIDDLKNVRLRLTADLGSATMLVREILELKQGSVIPLDKIAGEMTDLYVNGVQLGRGEVVVIADSLHIRIGEIEGLAEEDKDSNEDDF